MASMPPDEFKQAVYDLTRLIPRGRVTSYGAIARCIGATGASRRVGWALNQSFGVMPPVSGAAHFPEEVPMAAQLSEEGVEVIDLQIVGFDGIFWDPWTDAELAENAEL
jgi:methylated-DNA-protein-cysteine methyltransferase related protein